MGLLDKTQEARITEKVIIIGSGPAGHTAAVYAARADLHPLMFEGFMAGGVAAGGQLTTTTDVENYPGFPQGITGPELMQGMREQSVRFGTRIHTETVTSVDLTAQPFHVIVDDAAYHTHSLIIATGATAKKLNIPGVDTYWQKGISACAVCDGALPIFRDKPLVVIGGGDTACEESLYLTKFGSSVTMLVRRNVMRASKAMQKRVMENQKITVLWNTQAVEAVGDKKALNAVKITKENTESVLKAGGLFFAIGHKPNTEFLNAQLDTDEVGYIKTQHGTPLTSISGVFACGDVQDKKYRQAITAAGSGCMAALEAEHYLASLFQ